MITLLIFFAVLIAVGAFWTKAYFAGRNDLKRKLQEREFKNVSETKKLRDKRYLDSIATVRKRMRTYTRDE